VDGNGINGVGGVLDNGGCRGGEDKCTHMNLRAKEFVSRNR